MRGPHGRETEISREHSRKPPSSRRGGWGLGGPPCAVGALQLGEGHRGPAARLFHCLQPVDLHLGDRRLRSTRPEGEGGGNHPLCVDVYPCQKMKRPTAPAGVPDFWAGRIRRPEARRARPIIRYATGCSWHSANVRSRASSRACSSASPACVLAVHRVGENHLGPFEPPEENGASHLRRLTSSAVPSMVRAMPLRQLKRD